MKTYPVYAAYCVAEPALDQPSIISLALPPAAVVLVLTKRSCTSHSSGYVWIGEGVRRRSAQEAVDLKCFRGVARGR